MKLNTKEEELTFLDLRQFYKVPSYHLSNFNQKSQAPFFDRFFCSGSVFEQL